VVAAVETLMAFLVLLAGLVVAARLMAVTLVREHQGKVLLVVKAGRWELSMLAAAAEAQVLLELSEKAVVAHREMAAQVCVLALLAHEFSMLAVVEAAVLLVLTVDLPPQGVVEVVTIFRVMGLMGLQTLAVEVAALLLVVQVLVAQAALAS